MDNRVKKMNRYIKASYFHIASAKAHCDNFDKWIRRRLRMCLWKQWKRVKTRFHALGCTLMGCL
nr:group II intron maturase-specific domain-containing protein [Aneurinibacillus tyrosinisolvens]